MRIVANHAHLMPENSWMPGDADMLLRCLDTCGIDQAVVFPPFARQVENDLKEANLWALSQVRQHPDRLLPAGTLFPLAPNALDMLQFLAHEGVKLVKVHPSIDLHDVADAAAKPFYAGAEELGIALDYHTGAHGTRLSLARPEKFDEIAWDFPNLTLVFEHLGGRAYFEEFLAIICNHRRVADDSRQRVFGGLSSVLDDQNNRLWYLGPERIMEVVACAGADQLIFGLDFPYNTVARIQSDIATIRNLDIAADDKLRILGGNLARLLDPGGA